MPLGLYYFLIMGFKIGYKLHNLIIKSLTFYFATDGNLDVDFLFNTRIKKKM